MYGCENWTIKTAEHQRIDAFKLWCWRRLLKRVPWTARVSNQLIQRKSTLNIHWKDWCWSWSSNTLATWCEQLLIGKDPYAGKDWRQEEKGTTEGEMVGWHHWLDGHVFEQTSGVGDGQGSLACCSPWGRKESVTTEWLNSLVPELFLSHIAWQTTPNSVRYYELIIILAIKFIMLMNFMGQGIEQGSGSLFLPHGV